MEKGRLCLSTSALNYYRCRNGDEILVLVHIAALGIATMFNGIF